MLNRLAVALVLCAVPARVAAQGGVPDFDELRTPSAPAFTVLGISPAQVEHPTKPAAFATSFLESFADGGDVPKSFAFETTPYWWGHQPDLTFVDFQNRGLRSIYQDLSVSFAVTDSAPAGREVGEDGFQRLGVGIRLPVLFGTQATPECVGSLLQQLATLRARVTPIFVERARLPANEARIRANPAYGDTLRQEILDEVVAAGAESLAGESVESCAAKLTARQGLVLDLAGGLGMHFAGGRAESGALGSAAVWATPAYLRDWGGIAGVARAGWQDLDLDEGTTFLDFGARGIRSSDGWDISAEAVYRRLTDGGTADNLVRLSAIFDLKVTPATWVTVTLGRDFDAEEPRSLLALVNFQWNTGNTRPERSGLTLND